MPNTGHTAAEMPHVGKRIAERREQIGKRPVDIAKAVGISLSSYIRIEASEQLPGLFVYKQICRALNVSPGKLLESENENHDRRKQAKRSRRVLAPQA